MWYIHAMEYSPAIKSNDTGYNMDEWTLKPMPRERRQSEQTPYYRIPFIWNAQSRKIYRNRKQISRLPRGERMETEYFFGGTKVS